ncbi:MAG TPA: hypothetical protein VK885_00805 [Desulfotignum sp.]|jgi:hypothetical protein|nr:hypothetical protein [Desulfotignum sp.]
MKRFLWLEIKKLTKKFIDHLKNQSLKQNLTILDDIKRTGRYI